MKVENKRPVKLLAVRMFEMGLSEAEAQAIVDEAKDLKRTGPIGAEQIMNDFRQLSRSVFVDTTL